MKTYILISARYAEIAGGHVIVSEILTCAAQERNFRRRHVKAERICYVEMTR